MNIAAIPPATKNKAMTCSIRTRSFNQTAPMKAVKMGPTYWRMMALADVVVLLAATNRSMVAALATAAAIWGNEP